MVRRKESQYGRKGNNEGRARRKRGQDKYPRARRKEGQVGRAGNNEEMVRMKK